MYIHFRAGKLRIVMIIHRIKEIWKEKTNKEHSEFTAVYREAEIEKFGKLKKNLILSGMFEDYCMVYYLFFLVSLPVTGLLVGVNKLNSWWSRSRNGNYKAPTVDYRLTKPHIKGSGMCQWGSFFFLLTLHIRFCTLHAWRSRLLLLRILRRWFQIISIMPSQGHRQCSSTNNRRPEEICLVVLAKYREIPKISARAYIIYIIQRPFFGGAYIRRGLIIYGGKFEGNLRQGCQ